MSILSSSEGISRYIPVYTLDGICPHEDGTPPTRNCLFAALGWRSWNQLGCNVSEPDIIAAATGLADTSRQINGVNASLLSIGYNTVGLDDCYQALLVDSCHYPGFGEEATLSSLGHVSSRQQQLSPGCTNPNSSFPLNYTDQQCEGLAGPISGVSTADACAAACCQDPTCFVWQFCSAGACGGSQAPPKSCYTGTPNSCGAEPGSGWISMAAPAPYTFHNSSGVTQVNLTRFPDMRAMTDQIHALGIQAGWYGNNCFCSTLDGTYVPVPLINYRCASYT